MIKIDDVLYQHTKIVSSTGGADGVRDMDFLQSALSRPFQTFGGVDVYPTLIEKAAALLESILVNHPFVDGNKRTGYTVMRTFLRVNGFDIESDEDSKYNFVIAVASGEMHYESIVEWLTKNIITLG